MADVKLSTRVHGKKENKTAITGQRIRLCVSREKKRTKFHTHSFRKDASYIVHAPLFCKAKKNSRGLGKQKEYCWDHIHL